MPILDSGFLSVIDIEEQESLFLDQWSSLQNITETSQWHQRPEVFQPIKCSGAPKKHSMAASSKTTEEDGDLFLKSKKTSKEKRGNKQKNGVIQVSESYDIIDYYWYLS